MKRRDITQLLKKGLKGKEAGRLILEDSWEVDHGREGFLSEADIQRIKKALKTQRDVDDYNRLWETYRLVAISRREANILALEAMYFLSKATKKLRDYWLDTLIQWQRSRLPVIMTEEQHQERFARQRERKLQEDTSLAQVLTEMAWSLASREQWDEAEKEADRLYEEAAPDELVSEPEDVLMDRYPELYEQARDEVVRLMREGKLSKGHAEDEEEIRALLDRINRDGDIEAFVPLAEKLLFSTEELYQAGVKWVVEWVDEYTPNLYEPDPSFGAGVAIIQKPHPWQLDEKGHFKQDYLDWMEDLTQVKALDSDLREGGMAGGMPEVIQLTVAAAKVKIKMFLAWQAVIATVSEVVGVDFTEDFETWYQEIEKEVNSYNLLAKDRKPGTEFLPEGTKVPALRFSMYKPAPDFIKYLRERMEISLGADWWTEVCEALEEELNDGQE